jgi:hypothetical protein
MYSPMAALASPGDAHERLWISSAFSVPKNDSTTALSQQSPVRLVDDHSVLYLAAVEDDWSLSESVTGAPLVEVTTGQFVRLLIHQPIP